MEVWQQFVVGIATTVGAAFGSWLIATYRQFGKMSDSLEKIAVAIEDHEYRITALEEDA